mmetsp:Transcript_72594/g.200260  ORF Transcript_72594/g.200260 Transcript_72594/m.200260 type:complete len:215 (+) Transcript_72594:155-799(+)
MLFACCCSEAQESDGQITFHSTTDERAAAQAHQAGRNVVLAQERRPPAARATAEEPSTVRSLSPEEKEREKERLQSLVNSFARKAVKGAPCTYFNEGTGERFSTQYRIDKGLEYLIILNAQDANHAEVTCPIIAIQDIYSVVEDGESCFPPEVLSTIKPTELEQLLMVVYRGGNDKIFRFCMLEESRESLDMFLECLRILCIYAQQASSLEAQA